MAIKVNGTTVINDSRALSNIASIDTATKNAMTAGGVGGLTTLVAENAAFGTGQVVKLSLGDYTQQTFWILNIKASGNSIPKMRLSNSSDVTITNNGGYLNQIRFHNTSSPSLKVDDDRIDITELNAPTAAQSKTMDARITVWNAYNSSVRTTWDIYTAYTTVGGGGGGQGVNRILAGNMEVAERNQSLVFYFNDSTSYVNGPTTYTTIGVN